MGQRLGWGSHYLMVAPEHFRVAYRINPYMDLARQPDPTRAGKQWADLRHALTAAGARVEARHQRSDAPDMVYAMNLGLALGGGEGARHPDKRVVLSHMRFAERRTETATAAEWFEQAGFRTAYVGRHGVGAHFEAGDAFPFADALVVGYGPRTDDLGLKAVATELGVRVRGVRITHPGMYHLDLAFCPLDSRRAMVCPEAFDDASAAALLDLVPEPLVISEEEALTFCANSVVVGRTVLMPHCPDRVRAILEDWGFEIVLVDVSEFHKGGGSIRCMTNPLDIAIGRDLPAVPSGEALTP